MGIDVLMISQVGSNDYTGHGSGTVTVSMHHGGVVDPSVEKKLSRPRIIIFH